MIVRVVNVKFSENRYLIDTIHTVEALVELSSGAPGAFLSGVTDCSRHGVRYGVMLEHLEPINPDNESSTWEEVQKLTNWNPQKVTA